MHDTTVVMSKEPTNRTPASEGAAKFECVHLKDIPAIARTRTAVFARSQTAMFVCSEPAAFHAGGLGWVWNLTSRITCLASRLGQAGNDEQEGFKLLFNSVTPPVQVYLPPQNFHNAMGFILQHLTPVARKRTEMPHDKQVELHHRLLRCGLQAGDPPDALILKEIECNNVRSPRHLVSTHQKNTLVGVVSSCTL